MFFVEPHTSFERLAFASCTRRSHSELYTHIRRNIKVFSSIAAYTIEHGAKESTAPDLMVSYHDNDHYNSVHSTKGKKPPPPVKTIAPSVAMESIRSTDSTHLGDESYNSSEARKRDGKADETKSPNSRITTKEIGKKGGKCPCGSGYSYRKCCRKKEQNSKTTRKSSDVGKTDESAKEHFVEHGFKVLKI